MSLSDQQQAAVDFTGSPTLLVAGAGSGKTRTLTAKIAHLISSGHDPERILAITFTNKAAEEMKNRLVALTGLPLSRFPWVRTCHSACFKILMKHCQRLGYESPLQVYGIYQQQKLVKDVLISLNYDKKYSESVRAAISNAKNTGNPLKHFEIRPRVSSIKIADAFNLYENELKNRNAVDFDNILLKARDLIRDYDDIRTEYQNKFEYILCDEYQDTNDLNEEITRLLLKDGNLFVVGDDWQSIYSFRMSNVNNFISFPKLYDNARVFRLEQNYRCADEIVRIANHLIENNASKIDKHCFSEITGGEVKIHHFFDDQEEADWIVGKIAQLARKKIPLNRIAVLYRTRFCSLSFEKSFRYADIPYQMMGGKGFFERLEIIDLNSYLAASVFDRDDSSFERVINTPKRGIGPAMIRKINSMRFGDMGLKGAAQKAVTEKILTPKVYSALGSLLTLLDDIRDMKPDMAVREVVERSGYMEYLKKLVKGKSTDLIARKENIEQLIHAASRYDTIESYLVDAALVREDREDDDEDAQNKVVLSTIHAAKGLEYEAVFVAGCEENLFPHWRSTQSPADLEEERRLMYVSITRSEKYLYLCSSDYRKGQYNLRSRFLDEIEDAMN
ncbi:UvrD-helicase domain-containing protein [Desulfobacterales bacterium HSG16]|nr:UvrD-helicase domain-containing protein [Desulfobacterales bacterium HSG16]